MSLLKKTNLKPFFIGIGLASWAAATIVVLAPVLPHLLYRLSPSMPNQLARNISSTAASSSVEEAPRSGGRVLPPLDSTLSKTPTLKIPTILVNGELHTSEFSEDILKKGLWLVPDFGTPENNQKAIIVAAHRWGYLDWTNSFRRLNSFYNLPKTKVGDEVKIIWNQREYTYQIYKGETATAISDYEADLILYTCELWNSPTRIFRYARRVL